MDGMHDLGGKQGFGPVDRAHEDEPFHGAHDARAYGLSVCLRTERPYVIDWFRHVRELMVPNDYMTRPYFDQWLQTALALAIDEGRLSLDEIAAAKADGPADGPTPPSAGDVAKAKVFPVNFERAAKESPAFKIGERIRTDAQGHAGHTRLPAYARGAVGEVEAYRGFHPLPDREAAGEEYAEPLYTVAFAMRDLFAEVTNDDVVTLDLWESYLERA